jgi:hypothetical protein
VCGTGISGRSERNVSGGDRAVAGPTRRVGVVRPHVGVHRRVARRPSLPSGRHTEDGAHKVEQRPGKLPGPEG